MWPLAYPTQLAAWLNAELARFGATAQANNFLGDGYAGGERSLTDARVSVGSGWSAISSNAAATLGGAFLTASGTTGNLAFTPASNVDTFEIYSANDGATPATVNANINGGSNTVISSTGAASLKKTVITAALGSNTCNLTWASGTPYMIGWNAYDSSKKTVNVLNSGWASSTSTDWQIGSVSGKPFHTLNAVGGIGADLTIISQVINDWRTQPSHATYLANIQSLITKAQLTGDVILMTDIPSQQGALGAPDLATQQAYVNDVISLAASNNVILVDTFARAISWPNYMYE